MCKETGESVTVGNGECDMGGEKGFRGEIGSEFLAKGIPSVGGVRDGFVETDRMEPSRIGDIFDFSEP